MTGTKTESLTRKATQAYNTLLADLRAWNPVAWGMVLVLVFPVAGLLSTVHPWLMGIALLPGIGFVLAYLHVILEFVLHPDSYTPPFDGEERELPSIRGTYIVLFVAGSLLSVWVVGHVGSLEPPVVFGQQCEQVLCDDFAFNLGD